MGVMPELAKAVLEMDWILPTDIQSEAIPLILGGGDVLMAAETGSGKTGAFCLPVLQIVSESLRNLRSGKSKPSTTTSSQTFKLNVRDRTSAMAIDSEGLLCQSRDPGGWHGARATLGVKNSGQYYYEATATDEGLCRVGWSTLNASYDVGTDAESYGFGGTGKMSHCRQFDTYGEPFTKGDTVGCYIDLTNGGWIRWAKNGKLFPNAYQVKAHQASAGIFPSVCVKNAEIRFNFGSKPFLFPPSPEWTAIWEANPANIAEPSPQSGTKSGAQVMPKPNAPLALIIEPSRELAEQTYDQIRKFKRHLTDTCPREVLLIGGANAKQQMDALHSGVDIVVATPGRLDDLISSNALSLANCRFFILDECDGLLSAGYLDMISRIHNRIPKVSSDGSRLQMIVCSATLHSFDVKKLANKLMHFPVWIDLKGQDTVPETVHHVVCYVDPSRDKSWIAKLNVRNRIQTDGVHERDRLDPDNLAPGPNSHKSTLSCVCLHSDRPPPERKGNLQKFKNGDVRFLICTDVAARGIDIAGLPYVINYTLPDEKQNYVHRIGRVGRAERMGLAISLVGSNKEKVWYHSNCSTRGRGCFNTRLVDQGGCCIWYNEPGLLGEVEEHLGVTIDTVDHRTIKVEANAFDGKVVYGAKLKQAGPKYQSHVDVLASSVKELHQLEKAAQQSYLRLKYGGELLC